MINYLRSKKNLAQALELCRNLYDVLYSQTEQLRITCPLCGHLWRQHDPEDGKCDAHSTEIFGVCQCGRDISWMQKKIADLSKQNLISWHIF